MTGSATWNAGTQAGTGTTQFESSLAIAGPAAKVISTGRIVNLNGATTWSGNTANINNAIQFAGGTVNNVGTFNDQNTFASFLDNVAGTNSFNNIGTYNKRANTITNVEVAFNNSGNTNVNAGTLLMLGLSNTTGAFNIASGGTVEFRNGAHMLNNATTSGAGTLAITTDNVGADALVTINGGTHTSAFLLSGSRLTGTDQLFQGKATWAGGAISGAASTTFANDVSISGPNTKLLGGGRVVNLNATTTWSGNTANNNNAIQFASGGTVNNNGTFNDANAFASFIEHSVGGPHNFNNIGTYNKQSNTITTSDLGIAFNNSGIVNVNAGTLRPSGGTSTGTFHIAAGATLDFRNGNNVLNNVTTDGAGTLAITTENVGADATVAINGGEHTTAFLLSGSRLTGTDHVFHGLASWTGGAISGAASTTFTNDVSISGANTKAIGGGRTVNLNATTTWSGNTGNNNNAIQFSGVGAINNNGTFNDANAFGSFIEHNVGGPHSFNNNGTYNKLANTVTTVDLGVVFNNSGLVDVQKGALIFSSGTQGTGTLQLSGGILDTRTTSTTGNLFHNTNAPNSLVLGARTLTVSNDYNNANFGVGDAFNRRANVSTTGVGNRLIASGDANQGVAGVGVLNGNTATPSLVIGNVHVGQTTFSYDIVNTGTTGPALRGAVQTGVNGGHISDARLSGNGVTAGNWGALAAGQALARDVTLNVATAGVFAPLTPQVVAVVNNFDNTRSQLLTITSAAGAAAYRLASTGALAPIDFGAVHVGDTVQHALAITNTAANDGFSEKLNAAFGAASDARITHSGSINLLGAGQTDNSNMVVGLNTANAGIVNGSIAVNFISDGAGTSSLGATLLPSQDVAVSGDIQTVATVFRLASASAVAPGAVNFGKVRVGAATDQTLALTNTAANDGFSEKLDAAFAGTSGDATASGAVNLLAAQATDNTGLHVTVGTATAGHKTGTATLALTSNGAGTSNLGTTPLAQQTVNVSADVFRLAHPTLNTPSITLIARVGDAAPNGLISITNASPDAFTERLNVAVGAAPNGFALNGNVAGLAAAATSTAISAQLDTSVAGNFSGSVALDFVSSGLGTTGAPDQSVGVQNVALTGRVYTPAVAQVNTPIVDFGIVHRGDVVDARNVSVTNAANVAAPNDDLRGSLGGASGPFTASGTLIGVTAQATDNASFVVGLDTDTAGVFNRLATASFSSHNAELADGALAGAAITLHAQVNNFAAGALQKTAGDGSLSANGDVFVLDFGRLLLGANDLSTTLGVFNTAFGPADVLDAAFDVGGVGPAFALTNFANFRDIAAGQGRDGLSVLFSSAALGLFEDRIVFHRFGHNASGFAGDLADATLLLRGQVFQASTDVPTPGSGLTVLGGCAALLLTRRYVRKTN